MAKGIHLGRGVPHLVALWSAMSLLLQPAVADAQTNFVRLSSFGIANQLGVNPEAPLVEDSGGILYGTTLNGGANGVGTVFKIAKNGTGYQVLKHFAGSDGDDPSSGLTLVSNSVLYGVCSAGGAWGSGCVYRLNKDGSNFQVVHDFGPEGDGRGLYPRGELTWGGDGYLYGITTAGGDYSSGTIFRVSHVGGTVETVYSFWGDSGSPGSAVTLGSDGWLYGVFPFGGSMGGGAVYKLARDGSGFALIHEFSWEGGDPVSPEGTLLQASDGALYGTTTFGGALGAGALFKLNKDGSGYATLKSFNGGSEGNNPGRGLVEGSDGALYGVCSFGGTYGFGVVFKIFKNGSSFRVLKSFNGTSGEPAYPTARLLRGSDNVLYGNTYSGGIGSWHLCCGGAAFKINQDGSGYGLIRSFLPSGGDGREAFGRLALSTDGYIYGTTLHGGNHDRGTVFRVKKDGSSYAQLKAFQGSGGDAMYPEHGVIVGSDGALYGAAHNGGGGNYGGAVFKMNRNGTGYTKLRSFGGGSDGLRPRGGVVEATNGFLYGTTSAGGSTGSGTIYRLTKTGASYSVIKHFAGADGASPSGSLIQASDGALYGSTVAGGANGVGVVYRINLDGTGYTVLRQLDGVPYGAPYEFNPPSPGALLEASDGVLYGTSFQGGTGIGVIFKLNKDGSGYAVLHEFVGVALGDGATPVDGLTEGADGMLYGTTRNGGLADLGTLFRLAKDGSGYEVLRHFSDVDGNGMLPRSCVTRDVDSALYGAASAGGAYGHGMTYVLGTPVVLTLQPEGATNTVGETATFSASATGIPTPTLQWRRNGLPLAGKTNATFSIVGVNDAVAGVYDLVAANVFGAITSQVAVLTINHVPVADAQSVTPDEDAPVNLSLTGTDPDGDALAFAVLTLPAHGQLTGVAPNVTYTPAANYFGPDSFTFQVSDGRTNSAVATVSIEVQSVNDRPVASPQAVALDEDGTLAITLSAVDVEGSPLTYETTAPSHGTLSGMPPNVLYTPNADFFGADSFTFTASDGSTNSLPATVGIEVRPVQDAPRALAQTVTASEDTPVAILLAGVDVDGDALTYAHTVPAHGSLTGTPPNLMYQPATNYFGPDSFTFTVNDGQEDSASALVTIEVLSVNDAPVARFTVAPLFLLPDQTNWVVVAPDTNGVVVVADASGSTDTESDALTFTWMLPPATNAAATGVVASLTLPPGVHTVRLEAFDGQDVGVAEAVVEVITAAAAVDQLTSLVESEIDKPQSLTSKLEAAVGSLQHGNTGAAINVLHAFQNYLNAPGSKIDPAVAAELTQIAQQVIDTLLAETSPPPATITRIERRAGQGSRVHFNGAPGRTHIVEASDDMVNWEPIGTASAVAEGAFEFEEGGGDRPSRFYRIRSR